MSKNHLDARSRSTWWIGLVLMAGAALAFDAGCSNKSRDGINQPDGQNDQVADSSAKPKPPENVGDWGTQDKDKDKDKDGFRHHRDSHKEPPVDFPPASPSLRLDPRQDSNISNSPAPKKPAPTGGEPAPPTVLDPSRPEKGESEGKPDKPGKKPDPPQTWKRDRQRPTFSRVYVGDGNSLELVSLQVTVTVEGPRARTVVDHIFRNPHDRQLEGTFEYPLPTGASPSYFAMFLGQTRDTVPPRFGRRGEAPPAQEALARLTPDQLVRHVDNTDWGRLQEARVVQKEKALETYEDIARGRIDPAVLEYAGGNTFSGRVFPIPPKGYNRVLIAYEELLPVSQSKAFYRFPLPDCKLSELQLTLHASLAECKEAVFRPDDAKKEEGGGRAMYSRTWTEKGPGGDAVFAFRPPRPEVQAISGRQNENGPRYVYARLRPELPVEAALLGDADFELPETFIAGAILRKNDVPPAYLKARQDDRRNVLSYLAEARRRSGEKDADGAARVLSSVIEEYPARGDALRLVGYRLLDLRQPAQAARLFQQVQRNRPFEPHSYRDLARSLEESGMFGLAAIQYEIVLAGTWHNRFRESLKQVVQEEYASMMRDAIRKKAVKGKLADHFGERLERMDTARFQSDLRVTISWNTDSTDVDLWVLEPDKTKVFYSAPKSPSGGELSQDQTQGYGPERYHIGKAKKGAYRVIVHYFSPNQNLLGGETHVNVIVTCFAGTPQETIERHTVILKKHGEEVEVCQVEF